MRGLRRRLLQRNLARAGRRRRPWPWRGSSRMTPGGSGGPRPSSAITPAPAVARRWADFLAWHPSLALTWPSRSEAARRKLAEWRIKDAQGPRRDRRRRRGRPPARPDAPEGREPRPRREGPRGRGRPRAIAARHRPGEASRPRRTSSTTGPRSSSRPSGPFLRRYPTSPHRDEAIRLAASLGSRLADRRARLDLEASSRSAGPPTLPDAAAGRPDPAGPGLPRPAPREPPPRRGRRACKTSSSGSSTSATSRRPASSPTQHPGKNFATRIARYQSYLEAHKQGGLFVREAMDAQARIAREWDAYDYRQAYDHLDRPPRRRGRGRQAPARLRERAQGRPIPRRRRSATSPGTTA